LAFLGRKTVDLRTLANTQALPSIRQSDVENLELPLPPAEKRRRIASQLSAQMAAAERLRQRLADQLDIINELPGALLREAFCGRV
jgi:restriction endonuclease S subunit